MEQSHNGICLRAHNKQQQPPWCLSCNKPFHMCSVHEWHLATDSCLGWGGSTPTWRNCGEYCYRRHNPSLIPFLLSSSTWTPSFQGSPGMQGETCCPSNQLLRPVRRGHGLMASPPCPSMPLLAEVHGGSSPYAFLSTGMLITFVPYQP